MIRKLTYVLMAVVLAHVASAGAMAAPLNKDAVAVIIGNKDYKSRIPTVDFAHNDADAFKAFVIDVLGYDPENIIDLRDASKAQLETAFGNRETHEGKLWRYISPKGKSDVVVFYSGHGVPGLKDKRGYILPVDADAETPEINGFPVDTLLANLGKLKTKSMTVFLDACFSGDSQGGRLVRSTSGITISPKLPGSSSSMTIITAAQGDQVASWDLKAKHGMFTKHLLDALRGEADGDGYGNGDMKVSLGEVREYLDDRLARAARREFGRHQNVWARGDSSTVLASMVIAPKIIVKPISIEEMDATYVAVKTANLRAAPSTNSEIVGSLSSGHTINVTGRVSAKNWFRLNDGSFVFGNLITPQDQYVRLQQQRAEPKTVPDIVKSRDSNKVLPEGTVRERYDFAYGLLRRLKMKEAEVALKEFLAAHGNDPLADNAHYWLGESYLGVRNYSNAATTFFRAYSKSPTGAKAPFNLYKLGVSLAGLEQVDDACATFEELLKKFNKARDNNIRQHANIKQSELGCDLDHLVKNELPITSSSKERLQSLAIEDVEEKNLKAIRLSASSDPMSASELSELHTKVISCLTTPFKRPKKSKKIQVRFSLNADGRLIGSPIVKKIDFQNEDPNVMRVFAESAKRAVLLCEPYNFLPVSKYKHWRDIQIALLIKGTESVDEELDTPRTDPKDMALKAEELRRKIYSMDKLIEGVWEKQYSKSFKKADLLVEISEIEEMLRLLTGNIEVFGHKFGSDNSAFSEMSDSVTALNNRFSEISN
jgi:tol-pal system protein YbgF